MARRVSPNTQTGPQPQSDLSISRRHKTEISEFSSSNSKKYSQPREAFYKSSYNSDKKKTLNLNLDMKKKLF